MSTAEETPRGAPQESKKECDWCRELIRIDALKCPHCRKWRKDIQEDINKNVKWAIIAFGCLVPLPFMAINVAHDGTWDEGRTLFSSGCFSIARFLSSLPGWVVLFCIAGFIMSFVMSRRYLKSARRKTGGGLREI